jgi:hypothetical protein
MAPIEVVVADGHVSDPACPAFDCDVIVTLAQVAMRDCDVLRARARMETPSQRATRNFTTCAAAALQSSFSIIELIGHHAAIWS